MAALRFEYNYLINPLFVMMGMAKCNYEGIQCRNFEVIGLLIGLKLCIYWEKKCTFIGLN